MNLRPKRKRLKRARNLVLGLLDGRFRVTVGSFRLLVVIRFGETQPNKIERACPLTKRNLAKKGSPQVENWKQIAGHSKSTFHSARSFCFNPMLNNFRGNSRYLWRCGWRYDRRNSILKLSNIKLDSISQFCQINLRGPHVPSVFSQKPSSPGLLVAFLFSFLRLPTSFLRVPNKSHT